MFGAWSLALNLVLIVLFPKPDGGLRPIGLFPIVIRIWMRTRAMLARAWEIANEVPAVFGGAGKGSQRAAWTVAFAAEASAFTAKRQLAALLDLVKAFERIPHHVVATAAARLGFNLVVLRLSLSAYRLARSIGVEGRVSAFLIATRGITAGSGFATLELRLLLHEAIIIATGRWPLLRLYLYVDDLTIVAAGSSEAAVTTVSQATNFFLCVFEKGFLLEVSCKKSFAVSSRPSLAAALVLTAPVSGERVRITPVQKVRNAFSYRCM